MSAWTCQEHGDKTDKDCLACEVVALARENEAMKDVIRRKNLDIERFQVALAAKRQDIMYLKEQLRREREKPKRSDNLT